MIAYVEGKVAEIRDNACVVITDGGVGYEIFCPRALWPAFSGRGRVSLYTSHVTREDAQELYGFESWDERVTFGVLTTISKVGARTALGILSVFRPDDLRRIVLDDDALALTRVSGIGKKTAQHVFLELKYKLDTEGLPATASAPAGRPAGVYRDALDGLSGLGYAEDEAGPVLKAVLREEPDLDVSGALRAALKALAKGRG